MRGGGGIVKQNVGLYVTLSFDLAFLPKSHTAQVWKEPQKVGSKSKCTISISHRVEVGLLTTVTLPLGFDPVSRLVLLYCHAT